jgi:hypothetical protein
MTGRSLRGFSVLATLVLAGLALSHELSYLLAHASGDGYVRAMREAGHDRYWTSFLSTVGVVTVALATVGLRQLRRLSRQAAASDRISSASTRDGSARTFGRMTVQLWLVLGVGTAVAYLVQENLESAVVGLPMPGLSVVGGEHVVALPVVAIASLLGAFIGALARWQRRILLARIRAAVATLRPRAPRRPRPPLDGRAPAPVHACRQNAVRAPPTRALCAS